MDQPEYGMGGGGEGEGGQAPPPLSTYLAVPELDQPEYGVGGGGEGEGGQAYQTLTQHHTLLTPPSAHTQ